MGKRSVNIRFPYAEKATRSFLDNINLLIEGQIIITLTDQYGWHNQFIVVVLNTVLVGIPK
ncbi:hypothetical protein CWM47_34090 [Spirosoma pollinicola]|uniref:Uncharacterized protein n=1 Tax=Spirosoma pollinicola TaxID=2057025 RepID=A0A2K8Z986_9BACT|nr:hypothetical protein CWM47_34090 [Spirosoma pollinicola]